MREGIHPEYHQAKVVCNCGNEFVTGSTKEDIHVEICSKCHSFLARTAIKLLRLVDVLTSSIVNMVLSRKHEMIRLRLSKSQPILLYRLI